MKKIYRKISSFLCALVVGMFFNFSVMAEEIKVSAKSAVVMDSVTGKILYEKNADTKMPMASTTKIMSAIIALESGNLDESFTVDSQAIKVEGSSMGLKEGDSVTLRDLCCGMLLPSGNDAANATAVRVSGSVEKFVELMNEKAKQLHLDSTHFVTPSGLDDYTDDHYSTAGDMAKLTAYAMKNKDFCEICSQSSIKLKFGNPPFERWLVNSNKLLKNFKECCGVKTGFTDKARRCLVSAWEKNGAKLICVTLNDPDDWADHKNLFENCLKLYDNEIIAGKDFYVNAVGGNSDLLKAGYESESFYLPRKSSEEITVKLYLPPFVYAPVKAGEKIGRAVFSINGEKIGEKDIVAKENLSFCTEEKQR